VQNDTTTNKELAKQFLPFLQRHQRLEAVCDHVVHGGRVKLFVPKQNAVIMVVLAGVQVPRTPRQGEQPEPGAAEALLFTRERCLQRTVEVSVDSMDKMGSYIGTIWADHQNLALGLVEHGLASAHFTADRLPYGHELFAAEKQAQARRIGVCAARGCLFAYA
jgi:staphylococcal nuclease domain-containing protein 1